MHFLEEEDIHPLGGYLSTLGVLDSEMIVYLFCMEAHSPGVFILGMFKERDTK